MRHPMRRYALSEAEPPRAGPARGFTALSTAVQFTLFVVAAFVVAIIVEFGSR